MAIHTHTHTHTHTIHTHNTYTTHTKSTQDPEWAKKAQMTHGMCHDSFMCDMTPLYV